jgi:hypothetical protein
MHRSPRLKNKKSPKGISEETLEEGCQPAPGGAPDSEQYLSGAPRTVRCAPNSEVTIGSNGRLLQTPTVG